MTTLNTERPADVTPDATPTRTTRTPEGAPPRARARELEGYRGLVGLSIVAFHVVQYAAQGRRDQPGARRRSPASRQSTCCS